MKFLDNLRLTVLTILYLSSWRILQISPRWCILLWQKVQLRRLIQHSFQYIPFYQQLWKKYNSRVYAIQALPIINKKVFRKFSPETYVYGSKPEKYTWRFTSGSSGEPFKFISLLSLPLDVHSTYVDFSLYRFLSWKGIAFSRVLSEIKILKIKFSSFSRSTRFFISIRELYENGRDAVQKIKDLNCDIVESYPSILIELAMLAKKYNLSKKLRFKYAISYGEVLNELQRRFIESTFHCEVYNRYGLEEFGVVGVECAFHSGFHLYGESFFMEILDEEGNEIQAGKLGRVVLTSFLNYAMPFIRYDTGDIGSFLLGSCPCGVTSPRFNIIGRHGLALNIASRTIHHLEFDLLFENLADEVIQYQLRKIGHADLAVLIVAGPLFGEETRNKIMARIKDYIGGQINVSIRVVGSIEHMASGKCQIVVDETTGE